MPILLMLVGTAAAQTATPTPAPWYTPTPYTFAYQTPVFDFGESSYALAEHMVQGYQMMNSGGGMDSFMTIVLVILLLVGAWSINFHIAKMK